MPLLDRKRISTYRDYHKQLRCNGNLSFKEARRLARYEYFGGLDTLASQLDRYYLTVKNRHPKSAAAMLAALKEQNLLEAEGSIKNCIETAYILYSFLSGFRLYTDLRQPITIINNQLFVNYQSVGEIE